MKFELIPLEFFLGQVRELDDKSKRVILSKIELIKLNPYRFKKVHSERFSRVFSIKLSIGRRATRLIYAVIGDKIFIVCLFDRDKGYRDLEKYLEKILDYRP